MGNNQTKNNPIMSAGGTASVGMSLGEIEKWMDEDLKRSGLSREDIEVEPFVGESFMNQSVNGYKILFRYPDGVAMRDLRHHEYVRMRFCPPYPVDKGGKRPKYGVATGAGNHCFFPKGIGDLLAEDGDEPLLLTEGEKKAAKAVKEGIPVIGITGIWNWMESKSNRKSQENAYRIHDDLLPYLHEGREVVIIFDSDARENKGKAKSFQLDVLRLAAELDKLGCSLYRVDMPQEKCSDAKVGLDDYLCKHSADDFRRYAETSRERVSVEEAKRLEDPYLQLTKEYGEPYEIRLNDRGIVSKVIYSPTWNAYFLMENHHLVFEPTEDSFYAYNPANGLWELCSVAGVQEMLTKDLRSYWSKYHASELHTLQFHLKVANLREGVEMLRGKVERPGFFKRSGKPVIHVRNGMLDLESMTLKPFSPDYHSRNQVPLDFNPDADCPRFINELLAPALDDDSIAVFQKYAGQILLGMNASQQFLLLEGTAGGGKGTLVDILKRVIGDANVAELRTKHLDERFEYANYVGKTLLIGSDVPGNFLQRAGAEAIKKLTGGDPIDAEFKHANRHCLLRGEFCIIVTSNNDLHVRLDGDSDAWRRRLILLCFVNPAPAKPIDNFAARLFNEEGEGILNWMVHGAVAFLEELKEHGRIHLPPALQDLADKLLYNSDSVHSFVADKVVQKCGESLLAANVFPEYVTYCNTNGLVSVCKNLFDKGLSREMKAQHDASCAHNCGPNGNSRGYRNFALV